MNDKEFLELTQKIKDGNATQEETLEALKRVNIFVKEYNNLLRELLEKIDKTKK